MRDIITYGNYICTPKWIINTFISTIPWINTEMIISQESIFLCGVLLCSMYYFYPIILTCKNLLPIRRKNCKDGNREIVFFVVL